MGGGGNGRVDVCAAIRSISCEIVSCPLFPSISIVEISWKHHTAYTAKLDNPPTPAPHQQTFGDTFMRWGCISVTEDNAAFIRSIASIALSRF